MIEGSSANKHTDHIHNAANIPAAYILIEGSSVSKHRDHNHNAANIPAAYILIEGRSVLKHDVHIGNAAGAASSGVAHGNIIFRPFGIFGSTYCTCIANGGIGTENGYAIAMEGKEQPTVIFAFSIYWRVARVTTIATLYITIALRAALAWRAVGAGIGRASASPTAASTTAGAMRKTKNCRKKQAKQSSSAKSTYT